MKENKTQKNIIRLSKSVLSLEEKEAVNEVLTKEYLGMGNYVKEFEKQLSNLFNRDAVCVVNGTAALHLALQACGIKKGDEVLVQSITYLASYQAISAVGATPIPCDITLDSFTLDIEDIKKKLTSKTKAIMPVHYAGALGDYEKIYAFAKENKLRIIEDAAHAFGTKNKNRYVGSFGDVVCFSFDGIKNITSGEGGCVVSSDQEVINKIKDLRLLGVINDSEARYEGKRSWDFDVNEQGWRYHMSDLMASIGLSQIKKLEEFAKARQNLAKFYDNLLENNQYIKFLKKDYNSIVPHIYPIILSETIDRNNFQEFLLQKGIQTGIHYKPNHFLTFYKKHLTGKLRNTDLIHKRIVTLPLHPDLNYKDIETVVLSIKEYISKFI